MSWLITIIIICGIIGYALNNSIENDKIESGILYQESSAIFLGGFPDVEGNKKVDINLFANDLRLDIKGYGIRIIKINSILNAEIKTNQQITNDINLGKLIIFGFFAFGMQDKKIVVKNYVDVTFNDMDGTKRDVILESKNNQELVRQLRCLLN